MLCPKCCGKTTVEETTVREDSVDRKRRCVVCGYKFKTVEVDTDYYERMVKRNDSRQRHS